MGQKRKKIGVAIPADAFDRFSRWCKEEGRIQQDMFGRALTWFLLQDPIVKSSILNSIDPRLGPAHATILRQLADEIEQGKPDRKGPIIGSVDRQRQHAQ
jgi:hypothetical protein